MASLIGYLLPIAGLEKTSDAFRSELFKRARAAGYDPSLLAAVMSFESGFDAHVQNRGGAPAWGLIQFWKPAWQAAAARLGIADSPFPDALLGMTAEQQLPFVIAYYDGTALKRKGTGSASDYYLATFMPAMIGAPPSWVLGKRDSTEVLRTPSGVSTGLSMGKVYAQNSGLDSTGDGVITVAETVSPVVRRVTDASARAPIPVWGEPGELGPAPPAQPQPESAPPYLMSSAGLLFFCRSCGALSSTVGVEVHK